MIVYGSSLRSSLRGLRYSDFVDHQAIATVADLRR
jgi:hypothetical protein